MKKKSVNISLSQLIDFLKEELNNLCHKQKKRGNQTLIFKVSLLAEVIFNC